MIAVTGATGHLGRLIVRELLDHDVPAGEVVAVADADEGLERGVLHTDSGDLTRLVGRPTTALSQAVSTALRD